MSEKLLHERLREWAVAELPIKELREYFIHFSDGGVLREISEEIECDYIPRAEHEAIVSHGAFAMLKAWAWENNMPFEDGQSITEWLDKWFIKRPVRDDTKQPLKVDDYEDLLTYSVADDGEWVATFADGQIEGMAWELFRAPGLKALDADGVEINVGDAVWISEDGYSNDYLVIGVYPWGIELRKNCESLPFNVPANIITHKEPDSLEKLQQFASEWANDDNVGNSSAGDFRDAMEEVASRLTALIERGA